MTNQFHKLLLSELHMVVYQPGDLSRLTDRLLCEAVTLNENLQALGFVLKPDALIQLAVSPSLHTFFKDVKALVPEVKAQPMYPGFPQQVMKMSEAEMKWNQFVHTFSILGIECITGGKVSNGWHPDNRALVRDKEDTTLLEARVLDLTTEEDAPRKSLSILLARRERLTKPELDLVVDAASLCTAEQMQELTVRFKENLELLFPKLLEEADRETALRTLRCICSHSGDVLRCTAAYLSRRRYHLRTSEKKLLVKLLESYPVWNLRQNLMQSNSLRERNLMILQHLDYNQYSRSPEHKETVRALRNSELLSWHGIGEELLQKHSPKALIHLAQRPGYMLRMLNRLLSLGYSQESILEILAPKSSSISVQLILQAIRSLSDRGSNLEEKKEQELQVCRNKYRQMFWQYEQWRIDDTCYWEKQDCINRYQYAFNNLLPGNSFLLEQNGCRQQAWQQRGEAQWSRDRQLKQAKEALQEALEPMEATLFRNAIALDKLKDTTVFHRWPYLRSVARYSMEQSGDTRQPSNAVLAEHLPIRFRKQETLLQMQIARQEAELADEKARIDTWQAEEWKKIHQTAAEEYDAEIRRIDIWEQTELAALEEKYRGLPDLHAAEREALTKQHKTELAQLEQKHRQQLAEAEKQQKRLPLLEQKELARIKEKYQRIERSLSFNDSAVEILKKLLQEHFRQTITPLKDKKVFFDLKQFDLKHSVLETGKRSKDGGYIRSGISWKIPDDAKYVRFFVYWNDPARVIVDLHAGGTTQDGNPFHVGWNTCFHGPGVLHSGDVLHSDAAQYVDIDMSAPLQEVYTNIHLWAGRNSFRDLETCYIGMMAVDQIGQDVKLYSPKNCFFTHELNQNCRNLFYGFVDVQDRYLRFVGQPNQNDMDWAGRPQVDDTFSLQDYLDCILEAQQVQIVHCPEDADVILSMGKNLSKKGISLVDSNFFLEC